MARKEKKAGPPTMSLVFVGMVCVFIVGAGSGYIWNKSQIDALGQQIRQCETRLEEAKGRRLMLDRTYAAMCSHDDLELRVKRMKLDLAPPSPDQIVRLPENPAMAQEEKLFAGRTALAGEEGRD